VEQAKYSQAEPSQKLKCSVCKKYHHGPHDYNYGSTNKPKGASANEASAPAAPKLEAAMVTITAEEKAEFDELKKKLLDLEKATQAHARAYLEQYMDESD
jgi:hypothetical protein